MASIIATLLEQLRPDAWRQDVGFSEDVAKTNSRLFDAASEEEAVAALNEWIGSNQPCLFGRHAAKIGMLSYCILFEKDLLRDDRHIRDKIQEARKQWSRDGFAGMKSGFVVLALSERIANALPSVSTLALAQRLCSLYLLEPIETGEIYLDTLELELPGKTSPMFRWSAGVNYFSAQGDRRWWHDHRVPGGMAFSVNSVGHMVKSSKVSSAIRELHQNLGVTEEEWSEATIDSLPKALLIAMKTIALASETSSGKATELLPLQRDVSDLPQCPVTLPDAMADKNYCEYLGHYHTDVTLPREYFLDDVDRPEGLHPHALDFTYLFDDRLENPDFINMGEGRQIRLESNEAVTLTSKERLNKRRKAVGRPVIDDLL